MEMKALVTVEPGLGVSGTPGDPGARASSHLPGLLPSAHTGLEDPAVPPISQRRSGR